MEPSPPSTPARAITVSSRRAKDPDNADPARQPGLKRARSLQEHDIEGPKRLLRKPGPTWDPPWSHESGQKKNLGYKTPSQNGCAARDSNPALRISRSGPPSPSRAAGVPAVIIPDLERHLAVHVKLSPGALVFHDVPVRQGNSRSAASWCGWWEQWGHAVTPQARSAVMSCSFTCSPFAPPGPALTRQASYASAADPASAGCPMRLLICDLRADILAGRDGGRIDCPCAVAGY
jgi:hypothetical protein